MAPAAAFDSQAHIRQCQGGRTAQIILPFDGGMVDMNRFLPQQPVAEAMRRGGIVHRNAGNINQAILLALDLQARAKYFQVMQAQFQGVERAPGERGLDAVESQRRQAGAIVNHHLSQLEVRTQAAPACLNIADSNFLPGGARDLRFDVGAIMADLGQHPPAQGNDDRRERQHPRHGGVEKNAAQ